MRTTLLLLAVALVACDGKDASGTDTKKTAQAAPAKAPPKTDEKTPAATQAPAAKQAPPSPPAVESTAGPAPQGVPVDGDADEAVAAAAGPVLDHTVKLLDGKDKSLADYRGKHVLVWGDVARDCPTHKDEADAFAARSRSPLSRGSRAAPPSPQRRKSSLPRRR